MTSTIRKNGKIIFVTLVAVLLGASAIVARTAISNLLKGHVHFPEGYIGEVLTMEDGQEFTVFRRLKVDHGGAVPADQAVFKVRFRFKNFGTRLNKRLSVIPAPFLMGMAGFREKYWTINEDTNEFQGIYQWATVEAAEQYPDSFIYGLMTKRAAGGTVSYEIIPHTDLSEYIGARSRKDSPAGD